MRMITFIGALALSATTAIAHEYKVGDIVVDHPFSFTTPTTAQTGAGYLTVTNNGETDDRLIGIEAAFDRVMLHNTTVTDDGVATMNHQEGGILVPAGETITLEPGGYHVMFMGLGGDPFEEGEEIPAKLIFENAGALELIFNVETREGHSVDKEEDHSGH